MASTPKRGPYGASSRTTKWRKKTRETCSQNDVEDVMAEEPPTNEFDNESEEMTDFDRMVEEMLTEEKEKISETSSDNDPLYTGCRLSLGMSMLLIVTFVMRHGLTGVALCDLLNLVELLCLAGNICRSSIFQYRQYFESLKHPLVLNYYCESCYYAMLQCTDKCPNCTKSSVKYYITIPIKDQLETILKSKAMDLESKSVIVKTIILSAVADAPARCLMMDLTQFNGFHGCPCCYATGETFAISEKGNSHIYMYNIEEEYYENGHDRERTDEDTMTKALQVEKNYVEGKRREPEPILGVKGISFMSLFPNTSHFVTTSFRDRQEWVIS